jgi:cbb3-type cytochrome c oxidase subunit III
VSNHKLKKLIALCESRKMIEDRVAQLGLTPPQVIELEETEEMLVSLQSLPNGDQLGDALTTYAQRCAACHNANGSGTLIAPAIDSPDLRATPLDELVQTINQGVPGTFMAGWQKILTPQQIDSLVNLIKNWPVLVQAGVEFPDTEMSSLPSSPEMIAAGKQLFDIACKSCHGVDAFGSPMAPALNNQIFLSQTPDAAIYQIIAGGVPGTRMPAWGSRLTDQDIQSLVAYLRDMEATAPPIVPPILGP